MCDVLLACEYPTLNGGERSLLAALPEIRRAGLRLAAAAPPRGPLAEAFAAAGVEVVPLELAIDGQHRRPLDEARLLIREAIGRTRPRLVHANSLAMSRLVGPVAAELGIPSLGHLRDIVSLTPPAIADLNRNARLVAVSRATRNWHVAAGLDAGKTFVLHNGVDLAQFRPRPPTGFLHREIGLSPDALIVGAVGQIILRKGWDLLAEAAGQIVADDPRAHFVLVGERHSRKEETVRLETALREAGSNGPLAGRLHLLGRRDDVDRLLAEFTLLVHPARQEPLGRVLLEAAAAGRAIVATDVGGTAEIFPFRSQAAVLVPPDDSTELAMGVASLLADPSDRAERGAAARRRAEEAFGAQRAGAALAGHYLELLTAPNAASRCRMTT
jgi:glycosyltransferase involved in cell wall biosynthesis